MNIHKRIETRRKELKLTNESLGAAIGVSWQSVQAWQRPNGTVPRLKLVPKVATALRLSENCLITGEGWEDRNLPVSGSDDESSIPAVPDVKLLAQAIFNLLLPYLDQDVLQKSKLLEKPPFLGVKFSEQDHPAQRRGEKNNNANHNNEQTNGAM
jgi:DNA-binding XRE family transcriptional regulator